MKNIIILFLFTIISIFLGFFAFDKNELFFIYSQYVYYFISITFFIWLYFSINFIISNKNEISGFVSSHKYALIASVIIVILFFWVSPPEYRILADEANLLSTSKSLYENKNVFVSLEEFNILGQKQEISFSLDKRLVFFPYILHLIHCLKGYSPDNVFIVNAIASFGCLFLLYFLTQSLWGKYYGYTSLLLLASYPLFIRYSMSAGYDVLNLFFALLSFLCFCKFCKDSSMQNTNLLIYTVALFSYTRYECSVMAIVIMVFALIIQSKKELEKLNPAFCIYPLLFVPNAWIMFFANTNTYLQVDKGEQVFSLDYLLNNLSNAFYFFLEFDSKQESIFIVALMAILSVFIFIEKYAKNKSETLAIIKRYKYHLSLVSIFLLIQIIIKFSYKYGDITIAENARFGMTFLPFVIFLCIYFIKHFLQKQTKYNTIVLLLVMMSMLQYWAKTQNNFHDRAKSISYRVFQTFRNFLEENYKDKNDLLIASDYSNFLTPLKYNSISIETLNKNFSILKTYIKENKYWNKLIVIQVFENGIYNKECVVKENKDFEIVYEKAIRDNSFIRFSAYK